MTISSKITSIIESGGFAVTAGIVPPESADASALAKAAEGLAGKVHAAIVTDGDGIRMSALAACVHLGAAGIEPVLELSTRDMNRIALQSTLVGAASLGVKAVLCAPGVHQTLTEAKNARGVFDVDPIQLVRAAVNLNHGTNLMVGTTVNPFSDPMELQVIGLEKAARVGARFVITAPVFNVERMNQWMAAVRERGLHEKLHIIAGILPLESSDEALDLREKFRWLDIPDAVVEKVGIHFAAEAAKELSKIDGVSGIHMYPAGEGRAEKVLDAARRELGRDL